MTYPTSALTSTPPRAPVPDGTPGSTPHGRSPDTPDPAELTLDVTQMALDVVGLVDPTPISDGANGIISLARGDWLGAGISALSMIPYVGDAAKLGKLGRYAETLAKAVDLAKVNPAIAQKLAPAMKKLSEAIGHVPLDKLPRPLREAIEPLKTKLDDFARVGVKDVSASVGKNQVTWTQNAAGETVRARATLNEVFPGASRTSSETAAQGQAAARGGADDVGGHIIGHRFVQNQGGRNMFPQNAQFNNSAYRKLENEWADWIKNGKQVEVDVQLNGGTAGRPDTISVQYKVTDPSTGEVVHVDRARFQNEAGQTFNRVPSRDMQ